MVDVERSLKAWDSVLRQCGGLAAVGALHGRPLRSTTCYRLQTFAAEDVETGQQFRVLVAVQANATGELVFQLLEGLLSGCCGRGHCSLDSSDY